MIELYIENQPADVGETYSTLLSFVVDDIKDFSAKHTHCSKTIILPGTKNNNALFGNIFNINRSTQYTPGAPNYGYNFNVAVHANALIFADNIQVFKGILRLLQINIDKDIIEYEVAVFGELGGFAAALGNNKLTGNTNPDGTLNPVNDLDFSAYNHNLTGINISATWDTAAAGSGYYYPLLDYGTYGRNATHTAPGKHSWVFQTFRPALYVSEYLTKIFAAAGYTYNFPLLATTRFKSLIIPFTGKANTKVSPYSFLVSAPTHNYNGMTDIIGDIPFTNHTLMGVFTADAGSTHFTATAAPGGLITVSISGTFTKSPAGSLSFALYINGVQNVITRYGSGMASGNFNITLNPTVSINTGDIINITGTGTAQSNINMGNTFMQVSEPTPVPLVYSDIVIANNAIPKNILQLDFISSIIKLFNLYVFEDPTTPKKLNIMPFADFFSSAKTVDWTAKLDRLKPIVIKPMSELNARFYTFNFKNDGDFYNDLYTKRYNENYGSVTYDSGFEFATDKKAMELIFSGSPLVGYPGEDKVYTTIFKSSGGVEENIDSNIRILQAKKILGVASWDLLQTDGTTVITSFTNYGYAGHYNDPNAPANDIQFGVPKELFFTLATGALNVNQFNVYYSSYMAEITDPDSKLLTASFRLTRLDIFNLSFANFIWIDGSLFRLNKIIDYNATVEDTCNVELLKCINTIY